MASLAKLFRSAVRPTPQIRPTLPTASRVPVAHHFSSSAPTRARNEPESDADPLQGFTELTDLVHETAETIETARPITQQRSIRTFGHACFAQPVDFSRGARVDSGNVRRSKRPFLGPGRREAEQKDIFRQLDIDPVFEATNSTLMSTFVTEMGKIRPRSVTNLTWRSQRKLGKAIRRAKMMGIIPQLSKKLLAQTNTTGRSFRRNS